MIGGERRIGGKRREQMRKRKVDQRERQIVAKMGKSRRKVEGLAEHSEVEN